MNWSRILGNIGRTLIGAGTLILLFVVYQLWGTAIHERRAQSSLRAEFASALEGSGLEVDRVVLDEAVLPERLDAAAFVPAAVVGDDPTIGDDLAAGTVEVGDDGAAAIDASFLPDGVLSTDHGPPPPPPDDGDAVAELRIPRIGVTKTVVEGVTTEQLKKGPGHYPGTPLPGQAGNASIAGHRTTYGAPFHEIDELEVNDLIYVTTLQGSFVYRVTEQLIVSPSDVWVLDPSDDNRLTLTTCHPKYSARERLVVVAELIGEPAQSDPAQLPGSGRIELPSELVDDDGTTASPTTTEPPATTVPTATTAATDDVAGGAPVATTTTPPPASRSFDDAAHGGLDGVRGSRVPALVWGLFAIAVAVAVWYAGRRWRRLPAYLLGAPAFLVVLFFFFEAFSALLPPGV